MKPVPLDSSKLVKTHNQQQSCINFFEIAVKKRILALVVILCIQVPILCLLYSSETARYWKYSSNFPESLRILVDIISSGASEKHAICTKGSCLEKKTIFDRKYQSSVTVPNIIKPNKDTNKDQFSPAVQSKDRNQAEKNSLSDFKEDDTYNHLPDCQSKPSGLQVEETGQYEVCNAHYHSLIDIELRNFHINETLTLPLTCPNTLGYLDISFANDPYTHEEIEEDNPLVSDGGHFKPPYCKSLWKVAIVIPFRDRDLHLRYFLQYMHPILQRQLLEYKIYIINQYGSGKFNRAKLMNIGFTEASKDFNFDCFVFHDVDLILENDHAMYSCPLQPRHLSVGVDKFNYHLPYLAIFDEKILWMTYRCFLYNSTCFKYAQDVCFEVDMLPRLKGMITYKGGVTQLTKEQFKKVNGYSNTFWGWGGEDDDMSNRLRIRHFTISRYPAYISKYRMISHGVEQGNERNPHRFALIKQTKLKWRYDGLSNLRYKVVAREDHTLYSNITANLFGPS